jgi:hypothetical protein
MGAHLHAQSVLADLKNVRSAISFGDAPADEEAEDFRPIALSANALEVSGTALFSGGIFSHALLGFLLV